MKERLNLFIHRVKESYHIRTKNPMTYIKHFLLIFYWSGIMGYCRSCGKRVHDYIVPDLVWKNVTGWIDGEGLLCYDCFCKLSDKKGISFRVVDKNYFKV